jgi:hypothetical protein
MVLMIVVIRAIHRTVVENTTMTENRPSTQLTQQEGESASESEAPYFLTSASDG